MSTITTSNKKGLVPLNKQLASVNAKIKQLAEIYKTSIKENNATFAIISKNLSKELEAINKKLSKPKKAKPSKAKK
jgi:hemerythrin-like domain-containing protein